MAENQNDSTQNGAGTPPEETVTPPAEQQEVKKVHHGVEDFLPKTKKK